MKKNTIIYQTIVVLLILATIGIVFYRLHAGIVLQPKIWKQEANGFYLQRYEMAKYLLRSKTLLGDSKTEVIDLLGEPDSFDPIENTFFYVTKEKYIYLDIDPVDLVYLAVIFDGNDFVQEVRLE